MDSNSYTKKDYELLIDKMKEDADRTYAAFNDRSAPGAKPSIGIRAPAQRQIAKDIIKSDFRGFLAQKSVGYHEEDMIRAMVISGAKMDIAERFSYMRDFVPTITNWAVCDTLCNDYKDARKHRAEVWEFILPYLKSKSEFELRFPIVMMLWHFTTEEYAPKALKLIADVNTEKYYVMMAAAWAYSQFFIYQRDITLPFIESRILDSTTQNKAIQKIRESFRVSKEDKDYLLRFKK